MALIAGASASLAIAFFPKCPVCWTAYMSVIGIGGLEQVPYSPWLRPALVVLMLLNVLSVWVRGRTAGRMIGFYLVAAGAMTILLSRDECRPRPGRGGRRPAHGGRFAGQRDGASLSGEYQPKQYWLQRAVDRDSPGRENGAALWSSEGDTRRHHREHVLAAAVSTISFRLVDVGARPELRVQQPAGSFPIKIVVA